MSDIELVIKIPEEKLHTIKNKMYCGIYDPDLYKAIANGTPLPKGHGCLKDVDDIALIDEQFYKRSDYVVAESAIDDAPTIIEADKTEIAIKTLEQETLEVEAAKLQKAYNKGFEDCIQAVKYVNMYIKGGKDNDL